MTTDSPRFAEPIECGSKDAADLIRQRCADALHPADDARTKTVLVSVDAPVKVRHQITQIVGRSHRSPTAGQASLTTGERRRIDFSETNIFHARSCKAIAIDADCDEDWVALYDPRLTVDEHREVYNQSGRHEITMRDMPAVIGGHY